MVVLHCVKQTVIIDISAHIISIYWQHSQIEIYIKLYILGLKLPILSVNYFLFTMFLRDHRFPHHKARLLQYVISPKITINPSFRQYQSFTLFFWVINNTKYLLLNINLVKESFFVITIWQQNN